MPPQDANPDALLRWIRAKQHQQDDALLHHLTGRDQFGKGGLAEGFRKLLEKYNERGENVEADRSLLIRLPANL